MYFQVTDALKAVYEIQNLPDAIEKLTQTTLRNVVGELELDQTLTSRDTINQKLRAILDDATDKWGVKVNRVELQDINPPQQIRDDMEKQMRAERERRAQVLSAEGEKRASILSAEGDRETQIATAEGERRAAIQRAQGLAEAKLWLGGDAKSIQTVMSAVQSPEQAFNTDCDEIHRITRRNCKLAAEDSLHALRSVRRFECTWFREANVGKRRDSPLTIVPLNTRNAPLP